MLFEDAAKEPKRTFDEEVLEGDVWQLNQHVLIVGDGFAFDDNWCSSVDPPVDTLFFDPPYEIEEAWALRYPSVSRLLVCCDPRRIYKASQLLEEHTHHFEFVWEPGTYHLSAIWPASRHRSILMGLRSEKDWTGWHAKIPRENYRPGIDTPMVALSSVFRRKVAREHKHEKPLDMVAALLNGLHSEHVLDPFCGSGTTLFAAPPSCRVTAVEKCPETARHILTRWIANGGTASLHARA